MRSFILAAGLATVLLAAAPVAALAPQTTAAVMTLEGTAGENALAQAFAAALTHPDPAHRRAFVQTNAGPAFVQREGMDGILRLFEAEYGRLAGAAVTAITVRDHQAAGTVTFRLADGGSRVVEIRFGGSPDQPRMANFGTDLPPLAPPA